MLPSCYKELVTEVSLYTQMTATNDTYVDVDSCLANSQPISISIELNLNQFGKRKNVSRSLTKYIQ